MTIDQTTGYLYFVFYDRRAASGNATDVTVARSTDGGSTFSNFKVSQTSFTPTSSVFFGDYTNIAAHNRKVYPIWMRLDGNALSVWVAPITDTVTVGVRHEGGYASAYALYQNYPNPFNPSTAIQFAVPVREQVSVVVFDALGREVATLVNRVLEAGVHTIVFHAWEHQISSGIYYYRMTAGAYRQTRRFILLE
jgi:hypothetical protein